MNRCCRLQILILGLSLGIVSLSAPARADEPAAPSADAPAADVTTPPAPKPAPVRAAKKPADAKGEEPLPTVEEIQRSFDEGAYEQTLQMLGRVLPLKGKAAADYNRYDLLMLKADAHIRLRTSAAASQAYKDAAGATDDPKASAKAALLSDLVKKSKGLLYTPRGKKNAAPIALDSAKGRDDALAAYWADERARVKGKVDKAARGRALPPIAEALKDVNAIRDVELGATGGDEETKRLATLLTDRGFDLMGSAIKRMAKQVDDISRSADEVIRSTIRVRRPSGGYGFIEQERRRGLEAEDIAILRRTVKEAPPIARAAEELAGVAGDEMQKRADEIIDTASDLVDNAKRAMEKG